MDLSHPLALCRAGARPTPLARIAYVKLMTAALPTSRCVNRRFLLPVMRTLVRVKSKRRLEKVVNKVANDTSNLRLKLLGLGLSSLDLGEGCDGQTEALAGRS